MRPKNRYAIWIAAIALFAAACAVYLPRGALSVQESDGAELATAAVTGSLVHPPGYPLYMSLAAILVKLFPNNPYATLAAFAAVLQALAGVIVLAACYFMLRSVVLSVALAAAWLFYEPVMRSAADAEVFALHHLLVAVLVLLSAYLVTVRSRQRLWVLLLGLICGLGGAHHLTIVLWAPLVVAMVLSAGYRQSGAKGAVGQMGVLILGALIGLLPYGLLLGAHGDFLAFKPLQGFNDLLRHILRMEYGTFQWHANPSTHDRSYLVHFAAFSFESIPLVIVAFPLIAVVAMARRSAFLVGLFLTCCLHIWFASKLTLPRFEVIHGEFVMRFYGMLALGGVFAAAAVLRQLVRTGRERVFASLLLLIPVALQLPKSLPGADNRADRTIEYELEMILQELPARAVFVSSLDRIAMGLHYKQLVERERPDVLVVVGTMLGSASYRAVLYKRAPFLRSLDFSRPLKLADVAALALKDDRSVFAYHETRLPPGFAGWPIGVTWQWLPAGYRPSHPEMTERLLAFCGRWPDGLGRLSPQRRHSRYIIDFVMLSPLQVQLQNITSEKVRQQLSRAILLLQRGEAAAARSACRQGLLQLVGKDDTAVRYYSPS